MKFQIGDLVRQFLNYPRRDFGIIIDKPYKYSNIVLWFKNGKLNLKQCLEGDQELVKL